MRRVEKRTIRSWSAIWVAALLMATFCGTAAAEVQVTGQKQISPRLLELTIDTPAFTEPTKVHVFLPAGYEAAPERRWPVTYALAGTMNNYDSFANFLGGEALSEGYPSIIVSPDGNSGYWSDWYNGGAFGPPEYETYVIDQLIGLIDSRYRTIPDRGHRAVFGISMGGYGAMMYAARHPDLFGAAATLSGAVDSNDPLIGLALSVSPSFDGAATDSIYGPRATEEIRWRGHNPTDLAGNLHDVDLQVRTANGVLNPEIGEGAGPQDALSCVVESGVYQGSINFHEKLDELGVKHLWKDYGNGCHTVPNFQRQVVDALDRFTGFFADPPRDPARFEYRSIEPGFDVWGWRFDADPRRAVEFLKVEAGRDAVTLEGSGQAAVTTPPWYRGLRAVDAGGRTVRPRPDGRIRFTVDLGPAHEVQQYTPGAGDSFRRVRMALRPHALVRVTARRARRGVRVCARAVGGTLRRANLRAGRRGVKVAVGPKTRCRVLRVRGRVPAFVVIRGKDAFGHAVRARAAVRRKR